MSNGSKARLWKRMMIVTALIVVAALGIWFFKYRDNGAPQYQTVVVTRGDLVQVVTAAGQLNPVTNVQVGCQISGIVQKLYADFNTRVTNGQIVAQLDPSTYRANLQVAEGDLANARAGLELARVNATRAGELLESKLIPQSDYDQSLANLHQAEAIVKVREAAVQNAKVNLDRCTIYSPVDGFVISRSIDVGQTVAASLNAPTLFVIANDLAQMQIDANVAEADVGGVEEDQNVDFTVDAFPNRTFRGQVVQVRNAPITVQNVVTYDTIIAVNNADLKLKPGMTANVSIIVAERNGTLRIPNAALRYRPPEPATNVAPRAAAAGTTPSTGGSAGVGTGQQRGGGFGQRSAGGSRSGGERRSSRTVYVLKDNKPQAVQIKTGITDGIYTEVTAGLSENDRVITSAVTKQGSSAPTQPASPFGGPRRF